ncbi:MAG: hypothetical protein L3K08_07320 [Thermoplasmata archaeon]|nr:hypothetical protein [Thermoplasmata archaeon]
MAARTPREMAWTFHETLLQILRNLNQAAERRSEVDGLELMELERSMARFWTVEMKEQQVQAALRVLMENRLVQEDSAPIYAWDRQRTVGDRFRITAEGKAYLFRQIDEKDRIR